MGRALHLVKGPDAALPLAALAQHVAAGDTVTIALLHGVPPPAVPTGVRLLRVPDDASYEKLLELIFESDQVITW